MSDLRPLDLMCFNQFRDHMASASGFYSVQCTFFRSLLFFLFLSSISSPIVQYADVVSLDLTVLEARYLRPLQIYSFTKVPPICPYKPS